MSTKPASFLSMYASRSRRSGGLLAAAGLLFLSQVGPSLPDSGSAEPVGNGRVIEEEDVSIERLREVFDAAFLKTEITSSGNLKIYDDRDFAYISLPEDMDLIRFSVTYGFKDGTSLEDKLALTNRVNNEVVVTRWSVTDAGKLDTDYYLSYENGVLGYQVVRSYKRFLSCGMSGLRKDEQGIVK